ncbi:MAG TPA: cytochrome d ubiquinol oxidase subunit II [Isosphaeraceae bacterium]|nr:cytochrome d ubiquinol oxidase subunit II [Isosphaeraceae bacterium]
MSLLLSVSPAALVATVMLLSLVIYVLFGGADYGAGVWDLLAGGPRAAEQRDLIAHAIAAVWEANHVWLIIVIVLLFTGFPGAFSAIMTTLHVPVSLMLICVVLRGSAFTFRSYENCAVAKERWNRVFSIPSVIAPVLLGSVIGAIATGEPGRAMTSHLPVPLFSAWLKLFPMVVGLFALNIFAFLAAVYMTLEAANVELREDFRRRAIISAVLLGSVAWAVYLPARTDAPGVYEGLSKSPWGWPVRYATGGFAIANLVALWHRRYQFARVTAMIQVALILWGCALAQYPLLVPPDIDIKTGAAPPIVLKWLLAVVGVGSLILIPSMYYLFRVFKGHTFLIGWVFRGSTRSYE